LAARLEDEIAAGARPKFTMDRVQVARISSRAGPRRRPVRITRLGAERRVALFPARSRDVGDLLPSPAQASGRQSPSVGRLGRNHHPYAEWSDFPAQCMGSAGYFGIVRREDRSLRWQRTGRFLRTRRLQRHRRSGRCWTSSPGQKGGVLRIGMSLASGCFDNRALQGGYKNRWTCWLG
jgi:hypothetical protein